MLVLYYKGRLVTRLPISVMKKGITMVELEAFLKKWFKYDKIKWQMPEL